MDVTSRSEELWLRFPELMRIFNDSPTPDRFFHHGGIRSPYTTIFDHLHALAQIVAIVGSDKDRLAASMEQASVTETAQEQIIRIERVLHELDHLNSTLRSQFDGFLSERSRELGELHQLLLQRLRHANEQHDEIGCR